MGTDNLFHRRKAKNAKALQRRAAQREAYAKVLIVCEGQTTEPHYFIGLRDHYGLKTANIEICGECGSDPGSVLLFAKQRYREEKDSGDAFDKVFCVFDKDAHARYNEAIYTIESAQPHGVFVAINSVPCFEYWLLLHFTYHTRPYSSLPGNTAGNQALTELKAYIPDYQKGATNIFKMLLEQLNYARHNAARSLHQAETNDTDNPTTRVHELVNFLLEIKTPNK